MQESLPLDEVTPSAPQVTPEPAIPEPAPPKQAIPKSVTPEPVIPEPILNDPFQYKVPDGNFGFIPRNISVLPPGIQVVGILMFKNQKSIAAVRLPKTGNQRVSEIYYIREGDIIEVPSNLLPNRRSSASRGSDDAEILFLVIEKITSQHVEVRSQSNIADKHIIR
jgi:hypothetical protein